MRLQSQGLWGYKLIKINYYIDFCEITRFLSERNTVISPSENTKKLLQYFERNYILCMTSHYLWSFILKCHIHRSVTFNVTNVYVLYSCIKYWNCVHVNENITELEIQWSFKWTNKYEWMNIEQLFCSFCLHWGLFSYIPILWRLEKVVQQRTFYTTLHHS